MPQPWRWMLVILTLAVPVSADENDDLLRDLQALQAPTAPVGEATLRQLVDSTLPVVAKVMGLSAPATVKVKVVSRNEARSKLLEVLHRDYPGDMLSRLGELLTATGLAEPSQDLTREATDLYSQNVSGFYDPHDKVLFLLADQPLDAQQLIVAHELAHAVQDEHLGLDAAAIARRGSEDAQLAFSAAIEGQAQETASLVLASQLGDLGMSADDTAALLSESTAMSAAQAASQAPVPWLGMQMSFPYSAGAKLVAAVKRPDDRVARSLLRRIPESTAEVLSPDGYQRDEHPRPGAVHLSDLLAGSTPVYSTVLGRANLDLFGQIHGGGELGEGWRGDRAEAVRLNGRVAAVWVVSFNTAAQAQRLANAMAAAVHTQVGVKAVQPDGTWYVVQTTGLTTALLEGVPDPQLPSVQKAALSAFGP